MTPGASVPESLKALAPEIAQHDAPGVVAMLSPFVERLRAPEPAAPVKDTADAIFAVCRTLYLHARSSEAIPLVHGLLDHCLRVGDRAQTRRAASVCGLLAAETADLVRSIEYHVQSLRIAAADEDRPEMARAWNNIGHAITISGRWELSSRCFRRAITLLEPTVEVSPTRFTALCNLADNHYQLGEIEEGIRRAREALQELEASSQSEPYATILLRRTLVRLLIAQDRAGEAAAHVAEAVAIAERFPSPRAAIAVDLMRAALDLAGGSADLALTRLDRTLARARKVPSTLHDALAYAVRAEELAGNPARALFRMQELGNHVYGHGVEQTRRAIEIAGIDPAEVALEHQREEMRARLTSMLNPPSAPRTWAALRRLAASAALRMDDTGWHGARVGALVRALALARGCSPLQALEMGLAAELHDIGMASIPAAILAKEGELNDSEREMVRKHTEAGGAMLLDDRHPRVLMARDVARYHHARWDGRGYPDRVAGTSIPLAARLCAVADAYDAMVCGIGHPAHTMAEAMAELRREAGLQFDPELVSCFDALVKGELDGLGVDPTSDPGMETFQDLVLSLKEDRGFV